MLHLPRSPFAIVACCAVLWLLHPLAGHAIATRPAQPMPPNTLLTGLVLNYNSPMWNDVLVEVHQSHRCVARTITDRGMFSLDLDGLVDPDRHFTVVVRGQLIDRGRLSAVRRVIATRCDLHLPSAQNVLLSSSVRYTKIPRWFSRITGIGVRRHGHRTLYIDQI